MQYRSRAAAPASPTAVASMMPSTRSSASSSHSHSDIASSSSLIYHSSEEEDFGDPDVLAHDISEFFGGIPAPKKPKKVKAPKALKQKTAKTHVVDLPLDATTTAAQPRESTSRLRRLCKAIVSTSKA